MLVTSAHAYTSSGSIYIGDSRVQGMVINDILNESNAVYGSGCGYSWFVGNDACTRIATNSKSGGIIGANNKMDASKSYDIFIWLGVNDLYLGANKYYQKYLELANGSWKKHNIHIVSVGPVQDAKASISNSDINKFNENMKKLISSSGKSNLNYIDLGYTESSIKGYDSAGLHYSKSDYQNIFNIMNSKKSSGNSGGYEKPSDGDSDDNSGEGIELPDINLEPLTCDDFFSEDLRDLTKTAYDVIKFLALFLTVILGMLDFGKGITEDNQDLIKKASKKFIKRLIALVVIFILPFIVNPIVEIAIGVESGTCGIF